MSEGERGREENIGRGGNEAGKKEGMRQEEGGRRKKTKSE